MLDTMLRRRPVSSRLVISAGYDPAKQTLDLELAPGRVYRYAGVPELVYQRFLRAPSLGAFYNAEIRDRYPCVEL